MILREGMVIHTFPDTDTEAYVRMIREYGYRTDVYEDHIRVGKPLKSVKLDAAKFSRLMRRKLKQKNITMLDLANELQTNLMTVRIWVRGIRIPRKDYRDDLITILGITEGELEECQIINQ